MSNSISRIAVSRMAMNARSPVSPRRTLHVLSSFFTSSAAWTGGGVSTSWGRLIFAGGLILISSSSTAQSKKALRPRKRVLTEAGACVWRSYSSHSSQCSRVMLASISGIRRPSRKVMKFATLML